MKLFLAPYLITLLSLVVVDVIWLAIMGPRVYQKYLSHLLAESPNWRPAVLFYLLYAFGIYFFVERWFLGQNVSLFSVFASGFIFGLVAYGTYDLTNHATLKDWPAFITVLDLAWGGTMTGTVATIAFLLQRKYF